MRDENKFLLCRVNVINPSIVIKNNSLPIDHFLLEEKGCVGVYGHPNSYAKIGYVGSFYTNTSYAKLLMDNYNDLVLRFIYKDIERSISDVCITHALDRVKDTLSMHVRFFFKHIY